MNELAGNPSSEVTHQPAVNHRRVVLLLFPRKETPPSQTGRTLWGRHILPAGSRAHDADRERSTEPRGRQGASAARTIRCQELHGRRTDRRHPDGGGVHHVTHQGYAGIGQHFRWYGNGTPAGATHKEPGLGSPDIRRSDCKVRSGIPLRQWKKPANTKEDQAWTEEPSSRQWASVPESFSGPDPG